MPIEARITNEEIKTRIETLKSHRIFYIVLSAVESVAIAITIQYSPSFSIEFWIAPGLLFVSMILLLLGVFIITDSIRYYSKALEYRLAWYEKIGEKHPKETSEKEAMKNFNRGSRTDDMSYNCLRISLLLFFYFFASLFFATGSFDISLRIGISVGMGIFFTLLVIWAYKDTHNKPWENFSQNSR